MGDQGRVSGEHDRGKVSGDQARDRHAAAGELPARLRDLREPDMTEDHRDRTSGRRQTATERMPRTRLVIAAPLDEGTWAETVAGVGSGGGHGPIQAELPPGAQAKIIARDRGLASVPGNAAQVGFLRNTDGFVHDYFGWHSSFDSIDWPPSCFSSLPMPSPSDNEPSDENEALLDAVSHRDAEEAADLLELETGAEAARVLSELNPMVAQRVLAEMEDGSRDAVIASASPEQARQWRENRAFPEDSIGWLMEPAPASFAPGVTVAESVEALRHLAKTAFITYGYVVDDEGKLLGLLVMRDLLLAAPETRLGDVMLRDPFSLDPGLELTDAMRLVVHRHYPVYPVSDGTGRLLGQVRGQKPLRGTRHRDQRPGRADGRGRGRRTAFHSSRPQPPLAASLAATEPPHLLRRRGRRRRLPGNARPHRRPRRLSPVLAGQSGNTGSQALAVALRGMTLGDLGKGGERKLVVKEGLLGLLNGLFTGLSAGIGMWLYAHFQGQSDAWILGLVVWMAMVASCVVSGLAGALIPLALKRFGADPATASGIFLTTATDVISIGAFLGLASWMVG